MRRDIPYFGISKDRIGRNLTLSVLAAAVTCGASWAGAAPLFYEHFNQDSLSGRWEFAQIMPSASVQERLRATAIGEPGSDSARVDIEVLGRQTFGFLSTKNTAQDRIVPTAADTIVFYSWNVTSDAADPTEVNPMRLRASAGDGSTAATATFREIPTLPGNTATPPIVVPSGGVFRKLTSAVYVPNEVVDDVGGKGFVMAFDVVNFFFAKIDNTISVRDFQAEQVPVSSLTGEAEVYSDDFVPHTEKYTWFELPDFAGGLRCVDGGGPGLSVNPVGGIQISPPIGDPINIHGQFAGLSYAFASWSLGVEGWTVAANKIYRVDYTLTSDAPSRDRAHLARLRFKAGSKDDYVYSTEVSSVGLSRFTFPPDADGENYTSFVMFPNEQAGLSVGVEFDVYAVDPADVGKITLKSIHVRSYDMPELTPLP